MDRNDEKDFAIFEYRIRPTMDFIMKILSCESSVEVIQPWQLRHKVADSALKTGYKYFILLEEEDLAYKWPDEI